MATSTRRLYLPLSAIEPTTGRFSTRAGAPWLPASLSSKKPPIGRKPSSGIFCRMRTTCCPVDPSANDDCGYPPQVASDQDGAGDALPDQRQCEQKREGQCGGAGGQTIRWLA